MENIEQNRFTLHTPCFTPGVTHPLFDQVRSEKKAAVHAASVMAFHFQSGHFKNALLPSLMPVIIGKPWRLAGSKEEEATGGKIVVMAAF